VQSLSVASNISLPQLESVSRAGLVDPDEETRLADGQVRALGIRTASVRAGLTSLSGGNQQKVVLAKWLALGSSILILDEPTTGVDIGAKAEIYALIGELAQRGTAILLVSSDLPELIGLSDRILVVSKGRIVAEEDRTTVTEERVVRAAFGGMAEL
jgi:ribose transport system ATP-binding protein